ncbi:MAG: metal ABC transporter permease [Bacteroides sp.]|nr:metal ABC transporter permease [Bacteroides sp.]MBD5376798.1 metal ABC transporter permease [Bacteroides sp.]
MIEYAFFQNALAGILIISVAAAIIGTYVVTRRLVSIAGGVTHACFGGLGLGYFLGVSPVAMAGAVAVASSLGVEWLARRHNVRADSAVAVVWALGMAIGVVFVFLTPGYVPELNTFLFGNILTIGRADLWAFGIYTTLLAAYYTVRFRVVTACAFDPDFARVSRLPVTAVTTVMTVFIAVGIVLTIRLVGVMLLMSMISLPQMIAETFTRRMAPMVAGATAVSVLCCTGGLFLATVINVPCSALMVLVLVGVYGMARLIKAIKPRHRAL